MTSEKQVLCQPNLVPRASFPLTSGRKTRALGATISGMRHRCRCAVSRITRIRLFPLFFHNSCSQSWSNILIQLVDLPKLQAPNCAKGMLHKSQMSSWIICTGTYTLVSFAAVIWVVTQRCGGAALRDDPNNGCEGDYVYASNVK